jgi:hypothetical protein
MFVLPIGFPHHRWQWHEVTGIGPTLITDVDRVVPGAGTPATRVVQVTADALEEAAGAKTMQVLVRDNNIDQALRVLKKKMQREGVFREMKRRRFLL